MQSDITILNTKLYLSFMVLKHVFFYSVFIVWYSSQLVKHMVNVVTYLNKKFL